MISSRLDVSFTPHPLHVSLHCIRIINDLKLRTSRFHSASLTVSTMYFGGHGDSHVRLRDPRNTLYLAGSRGFEPPSLYIRTTLYPLKLRPRI